MQIVFTTAHQPGADCSLYWPEAPSSAAVKELQDGTLRFVAADIHPFRVISGDGFLDFAQMLVNSGAAHGKYDVRKVIPHRTSVSKKLPYKVSEVKASLKAVISKKNYVALTSDGWTDDMLKIYVTITVHYFDNDMTLCSHILHTGRIDERKTANVIGKFVAFIVIEFECCRLSCFADCLNLVVTDMLANAHSELKTMISNCKRLVRHFKHAALQSRLKKKYWSIAQTVTYKLICRLFNSSFAVTVIEAGKPHKVELSVHYAGVDRYTTWWYS